MRHFPVFLDLNGRRVLVSGGGDAAVSKLRLLLKTEAAIAVYAPDPEPQILEWARAGRLRLTRRSIAEGDAICAAAVYGANEDDALDARAAAIGRRAGALVNIVDDLEGSDFITPALVDRDPVTVAIGTEGAAPVLARRIKAAVETSLSPQLGALARAGRDARPAADALPKGRVRRAFWSRWYDDVGPAALENGGEAALPWALETLIKEFEAGVADRGADRDTGRVDFVGAGPGDPELLTLKARRLLHDADVVVHDRLAAPEILELARREAEIIEVGKTPYGRSWAQPDIDALLVDRAAAGATVVRLKSGDPSVFGRLDEEMDALDRAGVPFAVTPGVTAAAAAAASIDASLTRRGRNGALRILTAHDVAGFAEQDWRGLSEPGAVAAIYMGVRAARFLQGRLLIHGAAPATPMAVVENASRADEKIVAATLETLPDAIEQAGVSGPAILFLGLSPRRAAAALDAAPNILQPLAAAGAAHP